MPELAVGNIRVGIFGKLPAYADFLSRDLPPSFLEPWDRWLHQSLAAGRNRANWQATYLASPIWRFQITAGVCGDSAWAGILMSSIDRVGRCYPMTVALPVPPLVDAAALMQSWRDGFQALESLALAALDGSIDISTFIELAGGVPARAPLPMLARPRARRAMPPAGPWVVDLNLPPGGLGSMTLGMVEMLLGGSFGSISVFWHTDWAEQPSRGVLAVGLPDPEATASLFDGDWQRMGGFS